MVKKSKTIKKPVTGDLRVWWIPQDPGEQFYVYVKNVREAKLVLDLLANYDLFQFKNRIKPDYCNAGGLQRFDADDVDPSEGYDGWADWYDDDSGLEFDWWCEENKDKVS